MNLGDAIQATILLVQAPCNDIVPAIDEGKGKLANPVHHLTPVLAWPVFYNVHLRNHRVLQGQICGKEDIDRVSRGG